MRNYSIKEYALMHNQSDDPEVYEVKIKEIENLFD